MVDFLVLYINVASTEQIFDIYIYIYSSVLVNEMPKSARYYIGRANSIVFTSKRLSLQPVSSERNHIYIYLILYLM